MAFESPALEYLQKRPSIPKRFALDQDSREPWPFFVLGSSAAARGPNRAPLLSLL